MSFAENLKNLRKEKNLTQENLASEILVSRTLITKYESGAVLPTEENLKRLADYFAVTTSELMPDEEKIAVAVKTSLKPLWISLTAFALIISLTSVLLLVLPVFSYGHFIDGDKSEYVYGTVSLLSAYFKCKNPLAVISFILCLICCVYTAFLFFADKSKREKILRISGAIFFGITICLLVITLIYGVKIIGSDSFQMNWHK